MPPCCCSPAYRPQALSRRLGHASMTTTQETYLHVIRELENKDVDIVMRALSTPDLEACGYRQECATSRLTTKGIAGIGPRHLEVSRINADQCRLYHWRCPRLPRSPRIEWSLHRQEEHEGTRQCHSSIRTGATHPSTRSSARSCAGRPEHNTTNLDLDRMNLMLDVLGHPEESFRVIHVTGTNGKGSTARMAEAICRAYGMRTGPVHLAASGTHQRAHRHRRPVAERRRLRGHLGSGQGPGRPGGRQDGGNRASRG